MSYENEDDENERLFAFQRLLDGSRNASEPIVDLTKLRQLCERGIPNHPPHLRPLAYSLLLENLPSDKGLWKSTLKSQRERYYNLVKSFMEELESQPSSSSSTYDKLILDISKDIKSLKSSFWRTRTNPTKSSPFKPLSDSQLPIQNDEEEISSDEDDMRIDGKNQVEPILARRALFKRIDLLNEIQHRGGFSRSKPVSTKGKEKASDQDKEDEEQEEIMSPKITLSIDPTPAPILSRLDSVKPTPLNTSSLQPNPINTQVQVDNGDNGKPNSPITLLSPKPIPSNSSNNSNLPYSGSLYYPETHIESLTRLIYIFLRSNPQLEYQLSFIEIISTFYLIHSGTNGGKPQLGNETLDYIEENTFWFLSSFFNEIDQIYLNPEIILSKLNNRLNWINQPLYNILILQRNLDSKLYAYRWFNNLFLKDLPKSKILNLFDFILSENLLNQSKQPKIDLIIDIGLSMILLVKDQLLERRSHTNSNSKKTIGLWDTSLDDQEEEDENLVFLKNLQILREFPIKQIGGIETIIDMAKQIRNARLDAEKSGELIDTIPASKSNLATESRPQTKSSPARVKEDNSNGILKASTSWSKALGSFWGSGTTTTTKPDQSKEKDCLIFESNIGKTNLENGSTHNSNEIIKIPSPSRDRSDTLDSTTSSIQERLSALTTNTPANKNQLNLNSLQSSPLPRSLILSSSINNINTSRRLSGTSSGSTSGRLLLHRRDSSSSITSSNSLSSPGTRRNSPPLSGTNGNYENAILSPPSSLKSPPGTGISNGLYRIGSRQRSRSSLGDQFSSPSNQNVKRDLKYGDNDENKDMDQTPCSGGRSRSNSTLSNSSTPRPISLTLSDYYRNENEDGNEKNEQ